MQLPPNLLSESCYVMLIVSYKLYSERLRFVSPINIFMKRVCYEYTTSMLSCCVSPLDGSHCVPFYCNFWINCPSVQLLHEFLSRRRLSRYRFTLQHCACLVCTHSAPNMTQWRELALRRCKRATACARSCARAHANNPVVIFLRRLVFSWVCGSTYIGQVPFVTGRHGLKAFRQQKGTDRWPSTSRTASPTTIGP
jgi:hypothetical protein